MQSVLLRCPKQARFHFGKTGLDENSSLYQTKEIIHSDTLFSALVNIAAKTFGEMAVHELIEAFRNHIRISSAYYCIEVYLNEQRQNTIYFLPKPSYLELQNQSAKNRKRVRRISYISKTVWEKGLLPNQWNSPSCYILQREFVLHDNDFPRSLVHQLNNIKTRIAAPKIADHLRKREDNIYFQTDLFLTDSEFDTTDGKIRIAPSFYFLMDGKLPDQKENQRIQNMLKTLIEIMVDEGIGGSISTGCGQLTSAEIQSFEFNMPKSPEHVVGMSLISPDQADNLDEIYRATISVRGGRKTANHGRLHRLKMINEGAIMSKAIKGDIVPIHPNNKYLRYGKAFSIPVHPNYVIDDIL